MTAAQFNARFDVGVYVRYYPQAGVEGIPTQTTSRAWDHGPSAVVAVRGYREGVAVNQIKVDSHE